MLERERAEQSALGSLHRRTGLMHLGTAASSSEDFRSVIDDLTVQNKKLKRKLKKYEKLHDAHLQNDKLFEIRVHGLPPHKKRELEETLRKFASGLYGAPVTSSSGRGSEQLSSVPPPMEQQVTASSSLGNVDSAYASASGQLSAQSGAGSSSNAHQKSMQEKAAMSSAQQRDIQTYLSDIPQGLLPKPVAMTEKSKKKVIVRRLEQIFAGKGASKGGHQQPLQQEEISQSAARADRTQREASGRLASKEGAREARIMRGKRKSLQAQEAQPEIPVEAPQPKAPAPNIASVDFMKRKTGGEESPDQRPTRPLDLDPNRAQVPEDNIKYLRHLGFSPLEAGSDEALVDGHGYMYLNVLINMAQLHTLNVTPEFVKKALEQYSKKLELSNDGRKVRWKGGSDLTRTSSNGSPDDNSNASGKPLTRIDSRTKSTLASASGDGSSEQLSRMQKMRESENKLAYVPLFFHQQDDDDDDTDNMSEWSSPHEEIAAADSSGLTSSGMRTTSSKKRQANDGPIIFYSKAPFVTDLSGDWRGANVVKAVNVQDYSTAPVHAVGIPPERLSLSRTESKGPISKQETASLNSADSMELDENVSGNSVHGFSKPASMMTASSSTDTSDSIDPVELEASGVGGVHPSDNFSLSIRSRHNLGQVAEPGSRGKNYPPRIRALLGGRQPSLPSKTACSQVPSGEILSSKRRDLAPSELPPPSFFPVSSPEDEDDFSDSEDDEDDEMLDSPVYSDRPLPSTAPQAFRWTANNASESEDDESDSDLESEDGDESPDMLAHARKVDPELVRLAEREYDAGLAERLAEDIPAGSSAATAGGGSGFNSPASPMNVEGSPTHGGASQEAGRKMQQPPRGILKRDRTGGDVQASLQGRKSKSPKLERMCA